jgi:hypothetical protein
MSVPQYISDLVTRPYSDQDLEPLDRAKKQVERIYQIDSIKCKFPLDDHKLEIVQITYLNRGKLYDLDFTLGNIYNRVLDEYERQTKIEIKTDYHTVCYNVLMVLDRFFTNYCKNTDIGKKYKLHPMKNITSKAKEIIKLIEQEYAKMELLVSKYSKVETFDNICELTRVASALVKYGSIERIMAELCYSDDLSLFKQITCLGILLSYSQADMFGLDLSNASETSYKFLKSTTYDGKYHDKYPLLDYLIDNASCIHQYEKKFFRLIKNINEQNHKFAERSIIK